MAGLIGQRQAETLLARAILTDRVAHAYLFLGPPGAGKATASRLFTQAMNCARQPAVASRQSSVHQPGGEGGPLPQAADCRLPSAVCRLPTDLSPGLPTAPPASRVPGRL